MKRKTMGWLIVFLLFIVYMLNYMDRSALSITAPLIEKELGFNAAEMGMIFSAFFIGYALFNFIGGWASDKVGPKTVFLIAALLWSVFCGLTGLVTGFIVQFSGKYDYAFYLAGAIAIVSSLLVFVFVKSKGFKANESQSCVH